MTFRADLLALKDRLMRRSRAFWLGAAGLTLGAGFIAASMTYSWFFSDLPKVPDAAALWVVNREPASTFIDRDGKVLAVRGPRYGEAVSLNALPAHVVQAFLAAEDKRFSSIPALTRPPSPAPQPPISAPAAPSKAARPSPSNWSKTCFCRRSRQSSANCKKPCFPCA
jgi:Membrane carboxypeptidase/penicillin-binding protein